MTQADLGVALVLFAISGASVAWQRFAGPASHERLKVYRYQLFAVRDELVWLVATGKIQEDDPLFQFLYGGVNYLIPRTKPMSVLAIVMALEESELRKLRSDDEFAKRFMDSVNHRDEEVRAVARRMFQVIAGILLNRSPFVWISVKWTRSGLRFASRCRELLSYMFKQQHLAYQYHKATQALAAGI